MGQIEVKSLAAPIPTTIVLDKMEMDCKPSPENTAEDVTTQNNNIHEDVLGDTCMTTKDHRAERNTKEESITCDQQGDEVTYQHEVDESNTKEKEVNVLVNIFSMVPVTVSH